MFRRIGDHIPDHEDGGAVDLFVGEGVRQLVERREDAPFLGQAGVLDDPDGRGGDRPASTRRRDKVAATATPI